MIIEKYVTMGERGQIVIPKEIRDREGIVVGDQIRLTDLNGELFMRVRKNKIDHEDKILELLRRAKFTNKDIEDIRKEREKE